MKVITLAILMMLSGVSLAAEKDYQIAWCNAHEGKMEVVMPSRKRADCITSTHAIEVDFAKKLFEAIGQSLHYAQQTGLRAGILLIVDKSKRQDVKNLRILRETIAYGLPIDVFVVEK